MILNRLRFISGILREDEVLRAKNDLIAHKFILNRVKKYCGEDFFTSRRTVVDMGCGKHFPHSFLFSLEGMDVIALDKSYILRNMSLRNLVKSLKFNGLLETARFIELDILLKKRLYYNMLTSFEKNAKVKTGFIKFIQDDAEKLDNIKDKSVDLLVSTDVFEHLHRPNEAARSISKVMKPGGISIHIIHLFTSISGGHNGDWMNFKKFEPWDHLRKGKFVLPDYLNKWRLSEYVETFNQFFPKVFSEYYSFSDKDVTVLLDDEVWVELKKNYPDLTKAEVLNEGLVIITKQS